MPTQQQHTQDVGCPSNSSFIENIWWKAAAHARNITGTATNTPTPKKRAPRRRIKSDASISKNILKNTLCDTFTDSDMLSMIPIPMLLYSM